MFVLVLNSYDIHNVLHDLVHVHSREVKSEFASPHQREVKGVVDHTQQEIRRRENNLSKLLGLRVGNLGQQQKNALENRVQRCAPFMVNGGKHRTDVLVQRPLSFQSNLRALVTEYEHEGLVDCSIVVVDYLEVVVVCMDNSRVWVVHLSEFLYLLVLLRYCSFLFARELAMDAEKQSITIGSVAQSLDHILGLDVGEFGITLTNVVCQLLKR